MKNKLDNLFSLLNEDKFQKRLKKFNIFVAVISIVYIGVLFNSSKEEITNIAVINFFEIILPYDNLFYCWAYMGKVFNKEYSRK